MPKYLMLAGASLLLSVISSLALSEETAADREFQQLQQRLHLQPLPQLPDNSQQPLFMLGQSLYFEKALSGNRNIACASCHQPNLGTSDGLPLSLGQGNDFIDSKVPQRLHGAVLRRSSPNLYNLAFTASQRMFWDSRVRFDESQNQFITPSAYLNGAKPPLSEITATLPNALAAQVLFPMVDRLEMRGMPGENEIADAVDEKDAWQAIVKRIVNVDYYRDLLARAYPDIQSPNDFNIGHFAKALGFYIESAFAVSNTPFDAYLRGDHSQMNEQEKKGMVVFFSSGGCFRCHNGPQFAKDVNANIGIPVIKFSQDAKADLGLFEITGDERDKYQFKTPGLRNVALSAPYMHNGAFATLEEVVNHYSSPQNTARNYVLRADFGSRLGESGFYFDSKATADAAKSLDFRVIDGLSLSKDDKANLVAFLKNSLTDRP